MDLSFPSNVAPESHGSVVMLDDDRLKANRPGAPESSHSSLDELTRETTTAMVGSHGQPVDRPPPAVPSANDRSDEVVAGIGYQKGAGVERKQLLKTMEVIRVGRFRVRDVP